MRLAMVSCISAANIAIELFHIRGLLVVWDLIVSESFDRYLQRERVTGA